MNSDHFSFWNLLKAIHPDVAIPVAVGSPNIGDDIQSLIAMRFFKTANYVERDNLESWPGKKILLCGYFQHPWQLHCNNIIIAGIYIHPAMEDKVSWESVKEVVHNQGFPAGARDLSTLAMFVRHGIPAIWVGCVSQLAKKEYHPFRSRRVSYGIRRDGFETIDMSLEYLKKESVEKRLELAANRLFAIGACAEIVTPRLHVYLPAIALGVPKVSLTFDQPVGLPDRFSGFADLNQIPNAIKLL